MPEGQLIRLLDHGHHGPLPRPDATHTSLDPHHCPLLLRQFCRLGGCASCLGHRLRPIGIALSEALLDLCSRCSRRFLPRDVHLCQAWWRVEQRVLERREAARRGDARDEAGSDLNRTASEGSLGPLHRVALAPRVRHGNEKIRHCVPPVLAVAKARHWHEWTWRQLLAARRRRWRWRFEDDRVYLPGHGLGARAARRGHIGRAPADARSHQTTQTTSTRL